MALVTGASDLFCIFLRPPGALSSEAPSSLGQVRCYLLPQFAPSTKTTGCVRDLLFLIHLCCVPCTVCTQLGSLLLTVKGTSCVVLVSLNPY